MHLSGFGGTAAEDPVSEPVPAVEAEEEPPVPTSDPALESQSESVVEGVMDVAHIEVTIVNDVAELERLAGIVDTFVADHGLSAKTAFNLNLSLDELITNIVSYGYTDGETHEIRVSFSLKDGFLITRIMDDAQEYDPFVQAPEPDLDLGVDERPIGGLGVFLVKELMSRTSYERLGSVNITTLWQSVAEES
jgi:sigma-B regulation protein RsbU (phosphoserine phosphatase)